MELGPQRKLSISLLGLMQIGYQKLIR